MTRRIKISIRRFAITFGVILLTVCTAFAGILLSADRAYAFDASNMNASNTVTIGELLLADYDTAQSDAKVFDGVQLWKLVDALRASTEDKATVQELSSKDAADIRALNGGKDLVVSIDGKQWTVADLRKADNGDLIATMWLASSAELSQWNLWHDDTPTDAYPGNMYATSYIRAHALNSGGCGYVKTQGATTLTPIAQSADHPYAKFTMQSVADGTRELSLTDYIVQPKDVAYQETETIRTYNDTWNTCPNEAWGIPDLASYFQAEYNYQDKEYYDEWASDYLWLPSIAETGYSGVTGIWDLSNAQRSNGANTWLRSGRHYGSGSSYYLTASGDGGSLLTVNTYAVRPAFHLDLTKAAADATERVSAPTIAAADKSKEYTGATQTIALQNFDSAKMTAKVTAKDAFGNAIADTDIAFDAAKGEVKVRFAGTYTVEISLSKPDEGFWTDATGGNDKRTLTFTIAQKQLALELTNTVPGQKWEWTIGGNYNAVLTATGILADDTVCLTATYTADQAGGASKSVAAVQAGTQTVATIVLSEIPIGTYKLTAALDKSAADNDNLNYTIAKSASNVGLPKAFTVLSKKIDTSKITWQYTALGPSGNPIPNGANQAEIAVGKQIAYQLFGTLDSHGAVTNKLEIKRSTLPKDDAGNLLVEIDNVTSSFNGTTYTDGYCNQSGSTVGHYTTKVLLKIVHDDYLFDNNKKQIELSIDWEIVKGKFDVSGVKWKYKYATDTGTVSNVYDPKTTKLEYNDGKVIRVEIDSTTLPLGLSAPGGIFDYQNASGIEVKAYKATVAGDTLEYDDACFEQPVDLTLDWEIFGKGIAVKWKPVPSGRYYLKELNCDPKYKEIVHYKYFAPDGSLLGIDEAGRQALADKVIADNIGSENPQTFAIEAYLDGKNSGNYRLLTDPARTTVSIGNDPYTAIEAHVSATTQYDGNAHYTQGEIQFTGASIGASDYTVTYYAGMDVTDLSKNKKLDGAPTDAGKYVIAIEMADGSYLLKQDAFAVEILSKQVSVPTVKQATFNGTEYSLLDLLAGFDAALMTLDLVTTATNAGTYRATVTLPNTNYVWATEDGATGSQEYALEWSISKVKLTEIWGMDGNGKPTLTVSSKYADYVQIAYEYYDADGNLVAESDLVAGQSYQVVAKLSASSAANFELADINGEVSQTPSESAPKQFVYGNDPNNPNGSGNNGNAAGGDGDSLANARWFRIAVFAALGMMGAITLLLLIISMQVGGIRNLRKRQARQGK